MICSPLPNMIVDMLNLRYMLKLSTSDILFRRDRNFGWMCWLNEKQSIVKILAGGWFLGIAFLSVRDGLASSSR
jgi:hypothetical protein